MAEPVSIGGEPHWVDWTVDVGPSEPVSVTKLIAQPKRERLSPATGLSRCSWLKPSPHRPPSGMAWPSEGHHRVTARCPKRWAGWWPVLRGWA